MKIQITWVMLSALLAFSCTSTKTGVEDSGSSLSLKMQNNGIKDGTQNMSQLTQTILNRDLAAVKIAASMGRAAIPEITQLLQNEDAIIRMITVNSMQEMEYFDSGELLFRAANDENLNVVNAAVAIIELHADLVSTELLVGLLQRLSNPNPKKRIVLILGSRLQLSEVAILESMCNVQEDKILVLSCLAALAKIGVNERREQFSRYFLSLKDDEVEMMNMFELSSYIHQTWLVPTLKHLLNNKAVVQSLGDSLPGFPKFLRVCDKAVALIAAIIPIEVSFHAEIASNFSDAQLQEVLEKVSNYRY